MMCAWCGGTTGPMAAAAGSTIGETVHADDCATAWRRWWERVRR